MKRPPAWVASAIRAATPLDANTLLIAASGRDLATTHDKSEGTISAFFRKSEWSEFFRKTPDGIVVDVDHLPQSLKIDALHVISTRYQPAPSLVADNGEQNPPHGTSDVLSVVSDLLARTERCIEDSNGSAAVLAILLNASEAVRNFSTTYVGALDTRSSFDLLATNSRVGREFVANAELNREELDVDLEKDLSLSASRIPFIDNRAGIAIPAMIDRDGLMSDEALRQILGPFTRKLARINETTGKRLVTFPFGDGKYILQQMEPGALIHAVGKMVARMDSTDGKPVEQPMAYLVEMCSKALNLDEDGLRWCSEPSLPVVEIGGASGSTPAAPITPVAKVDPEFYIDYDCMSLDERDALKQLALESNGNETFDSELLLLVRMASIYRDLSAAPRSFKRDAEAPTGVHSPVGRQDELAAVG